MKNKKLLAIALATAFVFGGNNNSIDINVPTAYAVPERFEDDLSIPEYDEAQKEEQEVRDAYNRKKNERISKETEYKKVKNRKPSFNDDMGKYLEKLKETKSAYLKAKGEEIALEKKLKEMQARSEAILQKYETTRYVDESGKDIISPESGEQGPKEIEGYKFLETKWNKYAFNIHVYTFDIDGYKNEIIAKINGLDSLSNEEKSQFIQKLESLNNKDELDNVYKEAESANEKAKALEDYKKKYSDKIDGLSDLTEEEKEAAKEEIANATSESEVTNAYNKAFSKNQDAKY